MLSNGLSQSFDMGEQTEGQKMISQTRLWAVALLCSVACSLSTVDSALKPRAGGSYRATLQNGAVLSFTLSETRDAKLAGHGALTAASSGVAFSVNGTVRKDSVHLRLLRTNGDTASLQGALNSFDRRQLIARFISFGGYTESNLSLERITVQEMF